MKRTLGFLISMSLIVATVTVGVSGVASAASLAHMAFGTDAGKAARVRVYDQDSGKLTADFAPFSGFRGGARVAVGDVDPTNAGDEVIVAAGPGGGPHVRVFDVTGTPLGGALVYGAKFRGGVYVTTGDIDGDGTDEIIVGPGEGRGPLVRSFDFDSGGAGFTKAAGPLGGFLAYGAGFKGGVRVGSGSSLAGSAGTNDEIVTGAGPGGGPHVKIFDGDSGAVLNSFFSTPGFSGGVYVSIGQVDGAGPQVQVGAGEGGEPSLMVFDGDFGNGGAPTVFLNVNLLHPSKTVGVRPGTVVNLGIASDDPNTGGDPNNGYAFGAGANNNVRFLDSDDNAPLNDLNNFWFTPFPDLPDIGVFIS